MSESEEKAQLVDYDSDGSFEKTSSDLENVGQNPILKIKIEKNMGTLHSLSQFRKGLIHSTVNDNAGPSKTTDENKDEQELQVKMNNFSTPVESDQSTNIEDDNNKNKNENTKAKIVSCEKMVMVGSKEFGDMKMLMVESNKQTREMSATLGRAAKRLEEVTHELVKALKMTVDRRRAELDREKAKIEATKLEAEKKTNDGEETIKAQTAKFDGKKNCHRCAKPGHRIENCPLSKDLWFCYYCQEIRSHKRVQESQG
ncbi:uncharacterized protein LOC123274131 [Cotesia glomerata]|uniref:uncharacterized protein LOC123274131 n=1 Tax=Cotesia glomerata TaxID=32391 RepID=UPI001D02F5FE|nr:uncharacterized protein LOC123274131 [Cotesia glomerata]